MDQDSSSAPNVADFAASAGSIIGQCAQFSATNHLEFNIKSSFRWLAEVSAGHTFSRQNS
jgi:hypothetical protein